MLEHMKSIGLESGAKMCHINSFDQITTGMIKDLWQTENLNKIMKNIAILFSIGSVEYPLWALRMLQENRYCWAARQFLY